MLNRKEIDEDDEIELLIQKGLLSREQQRYLRTGRNPNPNHRYSLHGFFSQIEDLKNPQIQILMEKGFVSAEELIQRQLIRIIWPVLLPLPPIPALVTAGFISAKEIIWLSEPQGSGMTYISSEIFTYDLEKLEGSATARLNFILYREKIATLHFEKKLHYAPPFGVAEQDKAQLVLVYINHILSLRHLSLLPAMKTKIEYILPELAKEPAAAILKFVHDFIAKEAARAKISLVGRLFSQGMRTNPSLFSKLGQGLLEEIAAQTSDEKENFKHKERLCIAKKGFEGI